MACRGVESAQLKGLFSPKSTFVVRKCRSEKGQRFDTHGNLTDPSGRTGRTSKRSEPPKSFPIDPVAPPPARIKDKEARMFWLSSIIFLVLVTFAGCGTLSSLGQCTNPDVHFILSDGYVGSFRVVLDEAHGVETKLEKGRYVYEIPSGGELRVKAFDPFLGCS